MAFQANAFQQDAFQQPVQDNYRNHKGAPGAAGYHGGRGLVWYPDLVRGKKEPLPEAIEEAVQEAEAKAKPSIRIKPHTEREALRRTSKPAPIFFDADGFVMAFDHGRRSAPVRYAKPKRRNDDIQALIALGVL